MTHYFDADPAGPSDERRVEVTLPDVSFTMRTDRGVFSHGRLDLGTHLLLREAPPPAGTNLVDLGSGAGAIALTMAMRAPQATVWAVEVNARARALCAANAADLGLANVNVVSPDDAPTAGITTLWSNPPIRIGKTALHELLGTWLARLDSGGTAVLVVQRHLGADSLATWLRGEGHRVDRISSRAGYRLLRVEPPGPSDAARPGRDVGAARDSDAGRVDGDAQP